MARPRMRIAHIVEGFSGGLCTYMCHVLPGLVRRGFHVTLITSLVHSYPDAVERIRWLAGQGVCIEIVPMSREVSLTRDVRAFVALVRRLSHDRFDIVHTHCSKAGALGRLAARVTGMTAIVHSPHCFAFLRCGSPLQRKVYLLIERSLSCCTGMLAAVGPAEAAAALQYRITPRAPCVSVNNGVNGDMNIPCEVYSAGTDCSSGLELSARTRMIVTVCRLVEYKGIFRFLRAAELVKDPDCLFLIVGDGELRHAAEAYVCGHGLQGRVRFTGHLPDVRPIYKRAQMAVLCSDAEAMPYCLLEAMQAECPVIATAVPGNDQLVQHDRTGLLVPADPNAIAGAMEELLRNPEKRRRLATLAHDRIRRHYTLSRQIEQLTTVYESLLWRLKH
jgi:glycosyltransferase involved in cell wall biosynthesis